MVGKGLSTVSPAVLTQKLLGVGQPQLMYVCKDIYCVIGLSVQCCRGRAHWDRKIYHTINPLMQTSSMFASRYSLIFSLFYSALFLERMGILRPSFLLVRSVDTSLCSMATASSCHTPLQHMPVM